MQGIGEREWRGRKPRMPLHKLSHTHLFVFRFLPLLGPSQINRPRLTSKPTLYLQLKNIKQIFTEERLSQDSMGSPTGTVTDRFFWICALAALACIQLHWLYCYIKYTKIQ